MKKTAWILPMFLEGSGGHRTMFQNIQVLADNGYSNDVYVENKGQVENDEELRKQVERYFGKYDCNLILGFDRIQGDYDIAFATAWFTAKIVRDMPEHIKKVYFIQDFEALFNPMGDGYLMALNSYCYGLHPISIGHWLAYKMETEYSNPAQCFDFCADHKIYRNLNTERENAICFVYQPDKPRRCNIIGIEALGIVKYLRPDVKIYLYGSKEKGNVWFEHENLGIISLEKCNELYNKCRVGLCISSSNPSRVPFEMMAAGLPVVELYMENNLFDMPDNCVLLAHHTPESLAEAIIRLLDDKSLRDKMSANGIEYMKDKTLEKGYDQFLYAVNNIVEDKNVEMHMFERIYNKPPILADVIMNQIVHKEDMVNVTASKQYRFIQKLKKIKFLDNSKTLHKIYNYFRKI